MTEPRVAPYRDWRRVGRAIGARLGGPAGATTSGNAVYAGSQLAVLVVLARATNTVDVGRYALALAITAPIQIGLGMRLRSTRVVTDARLFDLQAYRRLALGTATLAVLLSCAIALVALPDGRGRATVAVVAFSKAVESLIDVSYGEFQRIGHLRTIAASQTLRGLLTVAAVAVGAALGGDVVSAVACMSAVWTAQYLLLDGRRAGRAELGRAESTRRDALRLARRAWPLGAAAALISFIGSSPRLVVAQLLSTELLGVFAVLSYPSILMTLIANSLGQAYLTSLARAFASGDSRRVRAIAGRASFAILVVGLTATAALVVAGRLLLTVIFGTQYGPYAGTAALLMLAATVGGLATIAYYALLGAGRFTHQLSVAALVAVVSVPAVWFPTAHWGMVGTALGLTGTFSVQWALMTLLTRRQLVSAAPAAFRRGGPLPPTSTG